MEGQIKKPLGRERLKGDEMLVLTDTDPAISSEDFYNLREILGKKLPNL